MEREREGRFWAKVDRCGADECWPWQAHLDRDGRRCVNPGHLEAVERSVNTLRGISPSAVNRRKVRCARGHALIEANTLISPGGAPRRQCRACNALRSRRYKARKLAAA